MSEPLVTIVIPAFNAEAVIRESVSSALGQSYHNIEIIVVDNGSTDRTCAAVRALSQEDGRVRFVESGPTGVSHARNVGIDVAQGKYIVFCDADDLMETNAVAILLKHAACADIVAGGMSFDSVNAGRKIVSSSLKQVAESVNARGKSLRDVFEYLWENNYLQSCWSKIYSIEFIKNNDIRFNENLSSYEDLVFILDCLSSGAVFVAIPELCYHYLRAPIGTSWSKYRLDKTEQMQYVAKCVGSFYEKILLDSGASDCMKHIIELLVVAVNNAQRTPGGLKLVKRAIADVFNRKVFAEAIIHATSYPNRYSQLLVHFGANRHYLVVALLAKFRNMIRDKYVAR